MQSARCGHARSAGRRAGSAGWRSRRVPVSAACISGVVPLCVAGVHVGAVIEEQYHDVVMSSLCSPVEGCHALLVTRRDVSATADDLLHEISAPTPCRVDQRRCARQEGCGIRCARDSRGGGSTLRNTVFRTTTGQDASHVRVIAFACCSERGPLPLVRLVYGCAAIEQRRDRGAMSGCCSDDQRRIAMTIRLVWRCAGPDQLAAGSSVLPACAAMCRAPLPVSSVVSGVAPADSSSCTASTC